MALIESLFRNYYVPPILFLITRDVEDPSEIVRLCMDGKQRLTSIQKFFDGQVREFMCVLFHVTYVEFQIPCNSLLSHLGGCAVLILPFSDKDTITKKKFWYTTPKSQAGNRLLIPEKYKRAFASKQITCGRDISQTSSSLVESRHS